VDAAWRRVAVLFVGALIAVSCATYSSTAASPAATTPKTKCQTTAAVDPKYACDQLQISWTGKLQSGHDDSGFHFTSSLAWTISFSGTLDDLTSGKVKPKFDSFNASESWSYDIGGGCTTTAHLNPDSPTQGLLIAIPPGTHATSGLNVPAFYQDSPGRKDYLVFGDLNFKEYPGPGLTGTQAIPDSPDVKYGCDGFRVDGPSSQSDAEKVWTPYALFSESGTADPSTPASTSVNWTDSNSHGQFTGQLTLSLNSSPQVGVHHALPATKKPKQKPKSSTTTTTAKLKVHP
jgi:hypothetical protein